MKIRGLCADHFPAPQTAEEENISQYVPMIEQSPEQCPPLDHIKPVEVPNETYGGSVKPFSTSAVHEVSLGPPGEEEENQPRAKEVGEDEAGQH